MKLEHNIHYVTGSFESDGRIDGTTLEISAGQGQGTYGHGDDFERSVRFDGHGLRVVEQGAGNGDPAIRNGVARVEIDQPSGDGPSAEHRDVDIGQAILLADR